MITYVNSVLVSNLTSSNVITTKAGFDAISVSDAGKFVVVALDENAAASDTNFPVVTASTADKYSRIKIGVVTNKTVAQVNHTTGATTYVPVIKWSNAISADSIKSYVSQNYVEDTEDTTIINFRSIDSNVLSSLAQGGKRVIVRLTFKDLPTRFRKWTESYEYVTVAGDTEKTIAQNIAKLINKQYKRARVIATPVIAAAGSNGAADTITATTTSTAANANAVKLEAMLYNDDNSVDTINWANKVRFNVNIYYTDPAAEGWESKNKNYPVGVIVNKTPGVRYTASAKLVRDREAQAMGYEGILNRGEGTWPIVKPDMVTDLNAKYCATTIEFERTYRAADDIFRKTKECVELYGACTLGDNGAISANGLAGIRAILDAFVGA